MPTNTERLRVLVVDDDADHAATLAFLVELLGGKAAIALGGHSGARLASEFKPDLAFIDLSMPGVGGCDLVEMLHSGDCDCGRPICVCLTGRNGARVQATCRKAGFDAFCTKPLRFESLKFMLDECHRRVHGSATPAMAA